MRISDWSSDVCSSDLQPPSLQFEFALLGTAHLQTSPFIAVQRSIVERTPRLPRVIHVVRQLAEDVAAAVRRRFRVSAIVPGFLPDGSAGRSSVMTFRSVADASAAADWCSFFGPITKTKPESRSSYYI